MVDRTELALCKGWLAEKIDDEATFADLVLVSQIPMVAAFLLGNIIAPRVFILLRQSRFFSLYILLLFFLFFFFYLSLLFRPT